MSSPAPAASASWWENSPPMNRSAPSPNASRTRSPAAPGQTATRLIAVSNGPVTAKDPGRINWFRRASMSRKAAGSTSPIRPRPMPGSDGDKGHRSWAAALGLSGRAPRNPSAWARSEACPSGAASRLVCTAKRLRPCRNTKASKAASGSSRSNRRRSRQGKGWCVRRRAQPRSKASLTVRTVTSNATRIPPSIAASVVPTVSPVLSQDSAQCGGKIFSRRAVSSPSLIGLSPYGNHVFRDSTFPPFSLQPGLPKAGGR